MDREREGDGTLHIPKYVQEVIERIAFVAREDKKIDKRSGVSQRLPISAIENVDFECRAARIRNGKDGRAAHQRYLCGASRHHRQTELEYEGEMKGADHVSRELIRAAMAKTFDDYLQRRQYAARSCSGSILAERFKLTRDAGAQEVLEGCDKFRG